MVVEKLYIRQFDEVPEDAIKRFFHSFKFPPDGYYDVVFGFGPLSQGFVEVRPSPEKKDRWVYFHRRHHSVLSNMTFRAVSVAYNLKVEVGRHIHRSEPHLWKVRFSHLRQSPPPLDDTVMLALQELFVEFGLEVRDPQINYPTSGPAQNETLA